MKIDIKENLSLVVILDISGVYAQIYDQGYYSSEDIEKIKLSLGDNSKWKIVII